MKGVKSCRVWLGVVLRSDLLGLRPISSRLMLLADEHIVLNRPHLTAIAGHAYSSIYRHRGSFNLIDHVLRHTITTLWLNS